MGCAAKGANDQVLSPQLSAAFVDTRRAICADCERNVDGICRSVAAKYGNNRAVIENGINRPSVACPKGKWKSIPVVCPGCSRLIEVNESAGICKWCQIKQGISTSSKHRHLGAGNRDNRDHVVRERLFPGDPVRHLHYFLYPRFADSVEYHLDQLEKSSWVFNGRKACCVATDKHTLEKEYASRIESYFDHVTYVPNDFKRRECVGFVGTLNNVLDNNENDMICFAHAKGQQAHCHNAAPIRIWTDAMYETVVRNPQEVELAFARGYPVAGAFKCVGAFRSTPYVWHYSGSFWWGRSAAIMENPLREVLCSAWWGTESYVGRHWMSHEGYCTFADGIRCGTLQYEAISKKVAERLETWRQSHNGN